MKMNSIFIEPHTQSKTRQAPSRSLIDYFAITTPSHSKIKICKLVFFEDASASAAMNYKPKQSRTLVIRNGIFSK